MYFKEQDIILLLDMPILLVTWNGVLTQPINVTSQKHRRVAYSKNLPGESFSYAFHGDMARGEVYQMAVQSKPYLAFRTLD